MCGLSGILRNSDLREIDYHNSKRSLENLKSRGPDNLKSEKIAPNLIFNHSRLSIVDPSPINNQPMSSMCGRYILVYNGEIYNFLELKEKLIKSENFNHSHIKGIQDSFSDTRILIEYISEFGIVETLSVLNGMFAFALFDKKTQNLHLARDYYGQKPLYYYHSSELFTFSSLLKDCINLSSNYPEINKRTAQHGIQFGMSLLPETIVSGIFEVPPGYLLTLCIHDSYSIVKSFFDLKSRIRSNFQSLNCGQSFFDQLSNSISRHLVADCEIGLLLSGGIDSSLIASFLAKVVGNKKISAFTLNVPQSLSSRTSTQVATSLGINHHNIDLIKDEFSNLIDQTFEEIDIPVYDPAIFSSRYLYRKAKNLNCKVVLTGDGADERFAGYPRYYKKYLFNRFNPSFISNEIRKILNKLNQYSFLPRKLNQFSQMVLTNSPAESYLSMLSDNPSIYSQYDCIQFLVQDLFIKDSNPELYSQIDQRFFLPNKMLLKADRAGMLESVESRSPFLDLSFFSLNNLIDNYEPKRLLKMELKGLLSDYPLEAKKEGFFSPYKLLLTTNSIKKLINSNIFSKVDEIIGLPKFSNRFKNELKYLKYGKHVPNSVWNYLALSKWIELNIL